MKHAFAVALIGLALASPVAAQTSAPAADPQNTVYLETPHGRVTIRLRPDLAPKHVAQIKELTKRGYYNNVPFHRVIPGFMAQTGDGQRGDGTGKSDLPNIPAEFTKEPFKVGSVGMARAQDPNSANSQFFVCFEGCGSLTGQYTIVGDVTGGMEAVRKIKAGTAANNGSVSQPDRIVKMQLAADAK
ncbi:peptidylprolyl isomerase [Salinarimonas soli]|uniref:Peptidyl-prolyl cis-trans isomerase n=1 Tax=Salinarimonas soli TaxID=1638099 RepID=A0A5B2V9X6_9HYPH|nr:peptidylprolyl isomerase [Salinarimonas soli]KAA2235385.1 peptidylprolyl isomerase [Salinarimonas soli]